MHELSIAYSLVEIASQTALEVKAKKVEVIKLRVGALSGVVKEALLFSYDIVIEDTPLAGSRLDIEEVPVVVHCSGCGANSTLTGIQLFRCAQCDEPTADIVQGKELEIVSMEYTE